MLLLRKNSSILYIETWLEQAYNTVGTTDRIMFIQVTESS